MQGQGISKITRPLSHNIQKKSEIQVLSGEFWTARQRQMHPLHYAISYRASFKPELPDYFIQRFLGSNPGTVLDPFGGRGTTTLQANMLGKAAVHNDANPVSLYLIKSRQTIPSLEVMTKRTLALDLKSSKNIPDNQLDSRLFPFFHRKTLSEIYRLRELILADRNAEDKALQYIGLTALSRLHGHSDGFFSVYSFPQISIMPQAQLRNNKNRGVQPVYKPIQDRILKKMKLDLSLALPDLYHQASSKNRYSNEDARNLKSCRTSSIDLVVTSPPFLNKVNYFDDNWMRAWFLGLENDFKKEDLTVTANLDDWKYFMKDVILELGRVLKPGSFAVIEVGEVVVKKQSVNLEEELLEFLPMTVKGGTLVAREVLVNAQSFTKLSNCWDVKNNKGGTNTNRCLILQKM